jgi:hypothetical protein
MPKTVIHLQINIRQNGGMIAITLHFQPGAKGMICIDEFKPSSRIMPRQPLLHDGTS